MQRVLGVATVLLALASPAAAQNDASQTSPPAKPSKPTKPTTPAKPAKPAERLFINVNGGIQTAPAGFDDGFDLTLYTENEHVTVDYPSKVGGLIAASVSYRLWKQFVVGLGATQSTSSGDATVTAELPHPFFDNRFRHIEGAADTSRDETGTHLMLGFVLPVSGRFRVVLSAGPSWLKVKQTVVTEVTFSETFPYDTAEFTGVKSTGGTESATGFNAGADVSWMFSRGIGIGGLVQYAHARVTANAGAGRTVSFDAGGTQVGAGIRFAF